jgi:hypothetical protein
MRAINEKCYFSIRVHDQLDTTGSPYLLTAQRYAGLLKQFVSLFGNFTSISKIIMTHFFSISRCFSLILLVVVGVSCTAPRSVIHSGKVSTPGQFKVGFNYGGNLASEPLGRLNDVGRAAVDAVLKQDSVFYDDQIDIFASSILAYTLDPVGAAFDMYIRYGLVPRVDIGYKYASGAHVFDGMYQFMGSTGTSEDPGPEGLYGSIGLQYSTQNLSFGSGFFLNKINNILRFEAKRKDILVPLVFSKSFGPEEEIGHLAWGLIYNHTFVDYGFEAGNIFRRINNRAEVLEGVREKNNFSSFGAFINAKFGFKYIYVLPALTVYYQNYGTYRIIGEREYSYSGMTFIPSIGVQARFGGRKSTRNAPSGY